MPSGLLIPGRGPAPARFASSRRADTVDALLLNNFEQGSNGVAVTPANSGGPASNNFELATGTVTYDGAQAAHGLLSMRADLAAGTTSGVFWNTSFGSPTRFQGRDYFRASGAPGVVARLLQTVLGASAIWGVAVDVTGKIGVRNLQAGTFATGGLSTRVPTPNTWHRYEFDAVWNAGAWTVTLWLFLDAGADGGVPSETLVTTGGLVLGGPVASYRFGAFTSASTTWTAWHDSIGLTTRGLLGPDLSPPRDPALAGLAGRTLYPGRGPSNLGRFFSTPRSTEIMTAAAAVTLQGVAQSANLPAGTLQVSRALQAASAAATRPAGSLGVSRALQAATLPASRPAGTLTVTRTLAASTAATVRPAATLTVRRALAVTVASSVRPAASVTVRRAVAASVRAAARVQAAIQVVTPSTRAPRFLIGAPVAKWVERGPAGKWKAGQPVAKWTIRGPVAKWRVGAPVRKWPPGPPTP